MGDKMLGLFRAEGGLNVNALLPLNNNTLSSTYAKFNKLQRISSAKTQEVAFAEQPSRSHSFQNFNALAQGSKYVLP